MLPRFTTPILVFIAPLFAAAAPVDLENHPGKAVYAKLCTECHGADGQGAAGKDYDPLVGTRTLESLAGRIERTMPEDNEDACVGDDAKAVAEYIFHAFYSPAAQARLKNETANAGLSRLTVPQYLNSTADLFGYFHEVWSPPYLEETGLEAAYYASGKLGVNRDAKGKDHFKQIDPVVKFDFGKGIPKVPEGKEFKAEQFSARWDGSIFIEETGVYEFVIRTSNGAYLNVNEHDEDRGKFIDAWVAPNNEVRDVKGRIFLIGGRLYPFHLHFFKFKQQQASIEVLWKPPHGTLETIPNRVLYPHWSPIVFVPKTTFPADDRSQGYDRGTTISRAWLDAVTTAAMEAADFASLHADELMRTKKDDPKRAEKFGKFGVKFTELAFRRPLSEQERIEFVDRRFQEADDLDTALRRLVILVLTSPRYLYPETAFDENHDPKWRRAARMALTFWDSIPNHYTHQMIREGKFDTPEAVEEMGWSFLHDGRARAKMRGFFEHWLELERAAELTKDPEKFPEFSPEFMAQLRRSLDLFIDETMWSEESDYRQLLQSNEIFLNDKLGLVFGKKDGLGPQFTKVSLPGNQSRSGVLTHPFLLSSFAYHNSTSPIHRGVFLSRNVVGIPLKPPPEAIEFDDHDFPADLTMREKVTELTKAKACMSCHSTINPLGFSLEHFDAIGRWRADDGKKPINDDSTLKTDTGETVEIKGPSEVADYAANSPAAHRAFIRQIFQHAVKRDPTEFGPDELEKLRTHFADSGCNMRYLLVKIGAAVALHEPDLKK